MRSIDKIELEAKANRSSDPGMKEFMLGYLIHTSKWGHHHPEAYRHGK